MEVGSGGILCECVCVFRTIAETLSIRMTTELIGRY